MTRAEKNLRRRQDLRTQSLLIQARAGGAWRVLNDDRWYKIIDRINVAVAANKFTQAQRHIQALRDLVDRSLEPKAPRTVPEEGGENVLPRTVPDKD